MFVVFIFFKYKSQYVLEMLSHRYGISEIALDFVLLK